MSILCNGFSFSFYRFLNFIYYFMIICLLTNLGSPLQNVDAGSELTFSSRLQEGSCQNSNLFFPVALDLEMGPTDKLCIPFSFLLHTSTIHFAYYDELQTFQSYQIQVLTLPTQLSYIFLLINLHLGPTPSLLLLSP